MEKQPACYQTDILEYDALESIVQKMGSFCSCSLHDWRHVWEALHFRIISLVSAMKQRYNKTALFAAA